jgi:2-methylisocitrate lyase-like PEP mutase family enzyme
MTRGKSFREAMKRGMVAAPGAYDCSTARSIERAGFDAKEGQHPPELGRRGLCFSP